jgi:hypothetical protein
MMKAGGEGVMRRALVVGDATSWFVHAHHPDMRRMPRPVPGRVLSDRTCAALVWNTFRTLALIDPSFWLRQLHARLFEFDQRYRAPETLDVRLWLPLEGSAEGERGGVTIDVLLESEDTWWGFLTAFDTDLVSDAIDVTQPDRIVQAVEALTWAAGARDVFLGFICSEPRSAPMTTELIERYAAFPHLLQHRAGARRSLRGLGSGTWRTIVDVLDDCLRAASLEEPERQAVRRCRSWFGAIGTSRDV